MNVIYITGLHRAGTHEFARWMAKQTGLYYVDEGEIEWDDLEAAVKLTEKLGRRYDIGTNTYSWVPIKKEAEKGMVIQCPGLAHETEALSKYGKTYWITRNHMDVVNSMKHQNFNQLAWHVMKGFKQKWPTDPIWGLLKYEGKEDPSCKFVGYYILLVMVKEYFFEKYLYQFAERAITEAQEYFDRFSSVSGKNPLTERELAMIGRHLTLWKEAYESLPVG
jgi:hypothetical protein